MKKKLLSLILAFSLFVSVLSVLPAISFAETSSFTEEEQNAAVITVKPGVADGSASAPLQIWNASQLSDFAAKVNSGEKVSGTDRYYTQANVKLMADIAYNVGYTYEITDVFSVKVTDPSGKVSYLGTARKGTVAAWYTDANCTSAGKASGFTEPTQWVPIGQSLAQAYLATFDGNSHKISGIFYAKNDNTSAGLFGHAGTNATDKVVIKNVSLLGACFVSSGPIGGIVAYLYNNINDPTSSSAPCDHSGGTCARGFKSKLTAATEQKEYSDILPFNISYCSNIKSVIVAGANNAGGIVGDCGNIYHYATNTKYRNSSASTSSNAVIYCTNSSTVVGKTNVGGIIGFGNVGAFDGNVNNGAVNGSGDYVAGIAGRSNNSTLNNLTNHGSVTASGSYVAGITGYSNRTVSYALNTGKITGASYVAGITAMQNQSGAAYGVQYAANLGEVYASSSNAAGFVATYSNSLSATKINNVYNYATVSSASAESAAAIAIIPALSSAAKTINVVNVYSVGGNMFVDLSGKSHLKISGQSYSNEITLAQIKDGTLLSKLSDFKKLESYPYPIPNNTYVDAQELSGSGTDADPYKIYTASDLAEFANRVNNGYVDELGIAVNPIELSAVLMDDINLNPGYEFELITEKGIVKVTKDGVSAYVGTGINGSEIAVWYKDASLTKGLPDGFVKPNEWTPIGVSGTTNYFSGNFEGNGHTITGMFIAKNESHVGLIGYAGGIGSDTTVGVSNLTIKDSVVIGKQNVGALAGSFVSNVGDKSTSSSSSNMCNHSVNTNCKRGQNVNCTIKYCHNDNTIVTATGGLVGGLIGYGGGGANHYYITNSNSNPTRVNNYGAISRIEYCTNSGEVLSSGDYSAGIIGNASRVSVFYHLTNTANITSSKNYTAGITGNKTWGETSSYLINTGDITGAEYTAGIIGSQQRTITHCLNTGNVTGTRYVSGVIAYQAISGYGPSYIANTGNVTASSDYAAGLISLLRDNVTSITITSSYNSGKITAPTHSSPVISSANTSATAKVTLDRVYATGGEALSINGTNVVLNSSSTYDNSITASQVYSGELAIILGSEFGQGENDPCPIPGSTDKVKWVLAGGSLNIISDIKANLYLVLSKDIDFSYTIETEIAGRISRIKVSDAKVENGYTVVTVNTAAKEMGDTITVRIFNGEEEVGFARTYSVKQYADSALSAGSTLSADAKAFVKAMLNYGGAAQRYFGYNTDKQVSSERVELDIPVAVKNTVKGNVTFHGASLVLDGELRLRFYFNGSSKGFDFTVDGKSVMATDGEDFCYVEVAVSPMDIGKAVTVTAGTTTVSYSAHTYLYNNRNKANLSDIVCAIYDYYLKAQIYTTPIATLSYIAIGGIEIANFSPDATEYEATVIETKYPELTATATVSGASVEIVQPTVANGGTATITVTSKDGKNKIIYKVKVTMVEYMDVAASIEKAKGGADSIVVIVHDDGDITTANFLADEFEENDLRGTIALITNKVCTIDSSGNRVVNQSAVNSWQGILNTGRFSLSSHTRNHVYWGRTDAGDSGQYYAVAGDESTLRDYTTKPGQITAEVAGSQEDLRTLFPSERVLTFIKAGFGKNVDGSQITAEATEIIKKYYITMRNTGGGVDTIPAADPYSVKSYMVKGGESASSWIGYVDEAISKNGMIVFLFHNIRDTGSGNTVSKSNASQLFEYVGDKKANGEVWVADFEEASLYTEEYRTASVSAKRYSDRIEVTLTDTWDNDVYNYALTVRVEVPDNWESVTQTVGGETTELEVQHDKDGYFVYASIVPDSGVATLTPNN